MLQKFAIQRRAEEHENQKRLLGKEKKNISAADWPSAALQKQAFICRPHRRLTSNFCFSLWSLRVSGLRLKARLLSSRRPKFSKRCTAESWRGKTSFLSCRGKKREKKQQSFKAFQANCYGNKNTADFSWTSPQWWGKSWQQQQRQFDCAVFGLPLCPLSLVNEIILQQLSAACYS